MIMENGPLQNKALVIELIILSVILLTLFLPSAIADRGGFSPIGESVSESAQKAIIAWNGTDEILMLSTDLMASNESEVVEIMPLPSNPTITRGDTQSFQEIKNLVNTYFDEEYPSIEKRWSIKGRFSGPNENDQAKESVTITFQTIIDAHFLTVIEATESQNLVAWLGDFLEEQGYAREPPQNLESLLEFYTQNGMPFFVIDMVRANSTISSLSSLVYAFKSPTLYYPLRISALFSGETDIALFTITSNELNQTSISEDGFTRKVQFQTNHESLVKIDQNLTPLFSGTPYPYICYWKFNGSLSSFQDGILVGFQPSLSLQTIIMPTIIIFAMTALVLLFSAFTIKHFNDGKTLDLRIDKFDVSLSFASVMGVLLVWSGFFPPFGLLAYGKNGEVLMVTSGWLEFSARNGAFVGFAFVILISATIPCCIYLLARKHSKGVSVSLLAISLYVLFQTFFSVVFHLQTAGIGTIIVPIGCLLIIISCSLSLWHLREVTPNHPTEISAETIKKSVLKENQFRLSLYLIFMLTFLTLIIWILPQNAF
jgi:hypothetical protein